MLPEAGSYAAGLVFLPDDDDDAGKARALVEQIAAEEGLRTLGWRPVPTDTEGLGSIALGAMPRIEQLFVASASAGTDLMSLERRAFVLRNAPSTLSTGSTSRPCRPARSSTRACSPRSN